MFLTSVLDEGLLRITLDDGKANAFNEQSIAAVNAALDDAEDASAVLLAGRPGKFSGGFDLNAMNGGDAEAVRTLVEAGGRLVHRVYGFPKPVIVAVTGHAVALGALMVLACDYRVGVAGPFKIGLTETAIGLPLPVFGMELARVRLPLSTFEKAVIHSQLHTPESAVPAGFLDEAVDADELLARAEAKARELGKLPGAVFAATKQQLRAPGLEAMAAGWS